MAASMLNDVAYDAYLANDRTLDDPEIVQVEKGGVIRIGMQGGESTNSLDPALARTWFAIAARQGSAMGHNMLGRCLEHGWGGQADAASAAAVTTVTVSPGARVTTVGPVKVSFVPLARTTGASPDTML